MNEKWKVFLSSSQHEELAQERVVLITHFKENRDFTDNFDPFYFEMGASHEDADTYCRKNARNCKIFVLILGSELREKVKDEYAEAVRGGAYIYVYMRKTDRRSAELKKFIRGVLHRKCVTKEFYEADDLVSQVKRDLLKCKSDAEREAERRTESAYFRDKMVESIDDGKQEKAIRLLTEVVFLEDSSKTKNKLYEALIEGLVSAYGGNSCSLQDLENWAIRKFKRINARRITPHISQTVERMLNQNRLVGDTDNFRLTRNRQRKIEIMFNEQKDRTRRTLQAFYSDFTKEIEETINREEFEGLVEKILIDIISANSFYFANEIIKKNIPSAIKSSSKLRNMIRGAVSSYCQSGDMLIWSSLIERILTSPNSSVQEWIAGRFKSYYILAALGMDPDCLEQQCAILSNYNIFLDSHIVIRAMVGAGDGFELCKEIVSRTRKQNIPMYVSPPMFEEIQRSFAATDQFVRKYGVERVIPFLKELKMKRSDDILRGFVKKRKKDRRLSWDTYIAPFYSKTDRNRLSTYLSKTMGVSLYNKEPLPNVYDRIRELRDELLSLRGIDLLPDKLESLPFEQKEKLRKAVRLRENEAEQIALIYILRREAEEEKKSAQYWLLTFDEYVKNLSVAKARSGDGFYQKPCFYQPPTWLDMLGTFGAEMIEEVAFREILRSEDLSYVSSVTEVDTITEIFKHSYDEKIPLETLRDIYYDTLNKSAIKDLEKEIAKAVTREEREAKIDKLRESVYISLKDRVEELEKSDKKRRRETRYLRKQVSMLRSKRDKKRRKKRNKR